MAKAKRKGPEPGGERIAPAGDEKAAAPIDEDETLAADEEERREIEAIREKWLRAVADLDNYRKRNARERGRELEQARASVILPILEVLDDLERALDHGLAAEGSSFQEGVGLIRRKFLGVLADLGVEPFDSVGEPFDPERHEAIQTIPAPDLSAGSVAAEIRRGYLTGGRVLRTAIVAVAAPPAKEKGARSGADDDEGSSESE